jgi:hypothetical protein
MDTQEFIEMDLQLGEAISEIKRLKEELAARDRRIATLQELFQQIIKTAQHSYSQSPERVRGFPGTSGKEVLKEAF